MKRGLALLLTTAGFGLIGFTSIEFALDQPAENGALPLRDSLNGKAFQHALPMLKSSDDSGKWPVRVLFYGQSITEQAWWLSVAEHLKQTFPEASITVENLAIGGHAAHLLVKAAHADVVASKPDLIFFHVYGSHHDYEKIIQTLQTQSSADIVLTTDHLVSSDELNEEDNSVLLRGFRYLKPALALFGLRSEHVDKQWIAWRNYVFLPDLAEKYSLALIDVRTEWKRHLRREKVNPPALLVDEIHLNAAGERLMATILKDRITKLKDVDVPGQSRRIGEWIPAAGTKHDTSAEQCFNATRADALIHVSVKDIDIRVNGVAPSTISDLYTNTRPSPFPRSNWPALLRVHSEANNTVEQVWTATIHAPDEEFSAFRFSVNGSVTGKDGVGTSDQDFLAPSGRISIRASDWNLQHATGVLGRRAEDGFVVRWKTQLNGLDKLTAPALSDPASLRVETMFNGLAPSVHRLSLQGTDLTGIRAVRFFVPAAASGNSRVGVVDCMRR